MRCHNCGHTWNYKGKSKHYATCPRCRFKVRINKKKDSTKKALTKATKIINKSLTGRQKGSASVNEVKRKLIKPKNIIQTKDGYYRYVCHPLKLLTTGWRNKKSLEKNSDIIRVDEGTIALMKKKYKIERFR